MKIDIWQQLKNDFNKKRLIILGEIHGAAVNPGIIYLFAKKLNASIIMVELETKWQKVFFKINNLNVKKIINLFKKEIWLFEGGLISEKHIEFFKKIASENRKIIPVKIENKNWNIAERQTAAVVKKFLNRYPKDKLILIVGNLHARKKAFLFNKKRLIPMGALINSISVKIRYGEGCFYNFGKKIIQDKKVIKLVKKGEKGLKYSKSRNFNYDYIVSKTKAIKQLKF